MANSDNSNPRPSSRRSRREERFAKQQEQQVRTLRLVGLALAGVIALILIVGFIVEFVFVPQQAVASVNGTEITMNEWQDQVRFQRGQLITSINDNYDLFFDDEAEDPADARQNTIRTLQQFFGQQMGALVQGHEQIGESVLENMISIELVRQAAAERGISVSQSEVDDSVGEQYGYFDGGLPTPIPTEEPTVQPTPSITPLPDPNAEPTESIPTVEAVEEEELPTATPRPTNTPVSEASFNESLQEDLTKLDDLGIDSTLSRQQAEQGLLFRALGKSLYEEAGGGDSAPHVSALLLIYATRDEAEAALVRIQSDGYLQVWNEVRSLPADPENQRPPIATEVIESTADVFARNFPEVLPEAILEVPVGGVSDIIEDVDAQTSLPSYIIAQVSSNEELELSSFAIQQLESEALQEWLTNERATADVEVFENWRNRVPRQPALEQEFWQPVDTPTPPAPGG